MTKYYRTCDLMGKPSLKAKHTTVNINTMLQRTEEIEGLLLPVPKTGHGKISQLSPQPAPKVQQHSCLVTLDVSTLSQKLASFRL